MDRPPMKIGILTSSRADFGIYQPLLNVFQKENQFFKVELIVFGTHLSRFHGYTIEEIISQYDFPIHKLYGMPLSDAPESVSNGYGNLVSNFSQFWSNNSFEIILCLGDRFEMSAAVQAGIPLGIKFAHIHGGETTLGAIDNIYRHQISLASDIHFVSTQSFADRVREITHDSKIYNVGALSLDGLETLNIPEWAVTKKTFNIPFDKFLLVTIHPETSNFSKNQEYAETTKQLLLQISKELPVIITMPNADTNGSIFRDFILEAENQNPESIKTIESFGRLHYFTAMKQAKFLLGNTSSGIIEAASFGKYVINIGDRQKGRPQSSNTENCPFEINSILSAFRSMMKKGDFIGQNIYAQKNTAQKIIQILKDEKF